MWRNIRLPTVAKTRVLEGMVVLISVLCGSDIWMKNVRGRKIANGIVRIKARDIRESYGKRRSLL